MKCKKTSVKTTGNRRALGAVYLTRAAIVAAIYITLTLVSSFFGLDKGLIQLRFSEALCILPMLFPAAVPGLYVGCLLANILTGCAIWDIIFGSAATLIGAVGAYLCRYLPEKIKFIGTLPNAVSNTLIVPLILMYAYGLDGGYLALMWPIALSELLCACVFGTILYYPLKKIVNKQKI